MKNESNMDLYMRNNNFETVECCKEYTKGSWTIRISEDGIEAFQDLSAKDLDKYVCLENTEENLFTLVEVINVLV